MRTPPPDWAVPEGYAFSGMGRCRGCGAEMAWAKTPAGKMAPLDRDGTNHFVSCPERERFRRRKDA